MCNYGPLMDQPLLPIEYGLLLIGFNFQPVLISALDKLAVIKLPLTGSDTQRLGGNGESYMTRTLVNVI